MSLGDETNIICAALVRDGLALPIVPDARKIVQQFFDDRQQQLALPRRDARGDREIAVDQQVALAYPLLLLTGVFVTLGVASCHGAIGTWTMRQFRRTSPAWLRLPHLRCFREADRPGVLRARIREINAGYPKASGQHREFYDNGFLKFAGNVKDGEQHGDWKWFRRGTIMRSGSFRAGTQTGVWVTYDRNGHPHKVTSRR